MVVVRVHVYSRSIFYIHNQLMGFHSHIYKEFSYCVEEYHLIFRLGLKVPN